MSWISRSRCVSDGAAAPGLSPHRLVAQRSAEAFVASDQRDRRHKPSVVGLVSVRGAAIAEKARLVGVSVETEIFEAANSTALRAHANKGVQIEHRTLRIVARSKEPVRIRFGLREGGDKFRPDLIGRLGD